ncbi:MAG: transposase [Gelidibacter sp.]|nr:transposase [Gelidibacter sp.]
MKFLGKHWKQITPSKNRRVMMEKSYNSVLMFKIPILQRLYNLSDEQIKDQLVDQLSFKLIYTHF